MKVYCQKCGAKIEFSVKSKPKFCHGCGDPLNLGSNRATAFAEVNVNDEVEEEEEINKIPTISELDVDITTHKTQGEKIGSIVGTGKDYNPKIFNNKTTALPREEFRKQFEQEAGTLRISGNPARTDEKE